MDILSKWKMAELTSLKEQEDKDLENLKAELKSLILNEGIKFGSGLDQQNRTYKWTSDTKAFLLNPRGLYITASLFMDKIRKYSPDAVGGLTLASHIITSALVYLNDSPKKFSGFLVRRERKLYDMAKIVEGNLEPKSKVVIVDDGLNAAGFAKKAIEEVENIGCKVLAVIVLMNFKNRDYDELLSKGYAVEHIFTMKDLGLDSRAIQSDKGMYSFKWKYEGINKTDHTAPKSAPVIENNRLYIGSDQSKVLCLDLSGSKTWEFGVDYHPKGVHQTPIIVGEKLIVSSYGGFIYAIGKNDGSLIWKNRVSYWMGSSPEYDKETGMVYVGTENATLKGTMAALDASTGRLLWEFTTNDHVPSKATICKDMLLFGSNDGYIYALDKKTGKLMWRFRTGGENKGIIANDDGCFYASSFNGSIHCIDTTGRMLWEKKLGIKLFSGPIIVDNLAIVASFSNQITALDKKTGEIKWFFMTGGPIQSHPLHKEGVVYFGSYDHSIYAIDLSGNLLWKYETGGPINSRPVIYENRLFISSMDGNLYCFERRSS